MVANTRGEANPLQAPPTFPQVAPAAGRSNASPRRRSAGRRRSASLRRLRSDSKSRRCSTRSASRSSSTAARQHPQHSSSRSRGSGEVRVHTRRWACRRATVASDIRGPRSARIPAVMATQPHGFRPRSGPHPTGASGEFIPRQSPRMQPDDPADRRADLRQPHDDGAALQAPPADVGRRGAVVLDRAAHRGRRDRDRVVDERVARRRLRGADGAASSPRARRASGGRSDRRSRCERRGRRGGLGSVLVGARRVQQRRHAAWLVARLRRAPPGPRRRRDRTAGDDRGGHARSRAVARSPAAPPSPRRRPPLPLRRRRVAAPVVAAAPPAPQAGSRRPLPRPLRPPPAAKKPAALGAITVVCMPKCDQIIDNGASLGPGHIFNRPVPVGSPRPAALGAERRAQEPGRRSRARADQRSPHVDGQVDRARARKSREV